MDKWDLQDKNKHKWCKNLKKRNKNAEMKNKQGYLYSSEIGLIG